MTASSALTVARLKDRLQGTHAITNGYAAIKKTSQPNGEPSKVLLEVFLFC